MRYEKLNKSKELKSKIDGLEKFERMMRKKINENAEDNRNNEESKI